MDQRQTRKISVVVLSTILVFLLIKIVSSVNTYRLESQSPAEKFLKSKETQDFARKIKSGLDEIEADQLDYFLMLNTSYNKRKANKYLKCQTVYIEQHKSTPMVTPEDIRMYIFKNVRRDERIDGTAAMSPQITSIASYFVKQPNGDLYLEYHGLDLKKITDTETNMFQKNILFEFKDPAYRLPIYPAPHSGTIGFKEEGIEQMDYQKSCGFFDILNRNEDGRLYDHK